MKDLTAALAGKRVLVTGGTGFIGSRLVEKLHLECRADVRVLVHNFANAVKIARFPVKMIKGDMTNPEDMKRATEGCEIVFNCAYGKWSPKGEEIWRKVNVEGTKNILDAAITNQIKRFIHLSSLMVYGITPDGDLDEKAPRKGIPGNPYAGIKIDSEAMVFDYYKKFGLPIVVLQPTGVFGPHAPTYCLNMIQQLHSKQMILVNGGDGLLNLVYLDDTVKAILLAAVEDKAIGQAFLISGRQPVTWREFYSRYEQMLNIRGTVSMSLSEAKEYYRRQQVKRPHIFKEALSIVRQEPIVKKRLSNTQELIFLKKMVKTLLPRQFVDSLKNKISSNGQITPESSGSEENKPILPIAPWALPFYASKTYVRIEKAERLLGYRPDFDFEMGMALTEKWAIWANLIAPMN
jgi:nucleoside-diphosphate-sugar epimerase